MPPVSAPRSATYDNQTPHMLEHILVAQEKERKAIVKFIKITQKQCLLLHISGQEILSSGIHNPYFSNI